ncbi:MAG TPA: SRPBCC domain-containing protein [Vicinamibacterales bacterium]|nr:SRPBCC domain-containing protein [Vicinamibacterales bacterium]
MDRPATEAAVVRITRTFQAPPPIVFKAWTDPAMMAEWFARAPGTPPGNVVEVNAVPGGRYVVEVVGPEDGKTYRMHGTYKEVRPYDRLSFTWWYTGADFAESLVTIDIRPSGESDSELTLTHALLPPHQIEGHRKGWTECFSMLDKAIAGKI